MNLWIDELIDTFEATAFYNGDEPIKTESDSYVLDSIKSDIETGKSILDFGCGTGRYLDLIESETAVNYTGYDTSEGMLKKAKSKFPENSFLSKLTTKKYDVVINVNTLQHSIDIEEIKSKIQDILKVGKKFILSFWYAEEFKDTTVTVSGHSFKEIFLSPAQIESELLPLFADYSVSVKYFPFNIPYKSAVIIAEKTATK